MQNPQMVELWLSLLWPRLVHIQHLMIPFVFILVKINFESQSGAVNSTTGVHDVYKIGHYMTETAKTTWTNQLQGDPTHSRYLWLMSLDNRTTTIYFVVILSSRIELLKGLLRENDTKRGSDRVVPLTRFVKQVELLKSYLLFCYYLFTDFYSCKDWKITSASIKEGLNISTIARIRWTPEKTRLADALAKDR